MNGASRSQSIFVVGMPRSGTTLISNILSAHSRVAITPETHFWRRLGKLRHGELGWEEFVHSFMTGPELQDFRLPEAVRDRIERQFRPLPTSTNLESRAFGLLESVCMAFAAQHGKTVWGEKTPAHLEALPCLAKAFPGASFVFMVRDPRDTSLSLTEVPWNTEAPLDHFLRWRRYLRLAREWKRQFPGRFFWVRYEDLVSAPEESVRRLSRQLGLTFQDEMLQFDETPIVTFDSAREPWKARSTRRIDDDRIGRWRRCMLAVDQASCDLVAGRGMDLLGYPRVFRMLPREAQAEALFRVVSSGIGLMLRRLRGTFMLEG